MSINTLVSSPASISTCCPSLSSAGKSDSDVDSLASTTFVDQEQDPISYFSSDDESDDEFDDDDSYDSDILEDPLEQDPRDFSSKFPQDKDISDAIFMDSMNITGEDSDAETSNVKCVDRYLNLNRHARPYVPSPYSKSPKNASSLASLPRITIPSPLDNDDFYGKFEESFGKAAYPSNTQLHRGSSMSLSSSDASSSPSTPLKRSDRIENLDDLDFRLDRAMSFANYHNRDKQLPSSSDRDEDSDLEYPFQTHPLKRYPSQSFATSIPQALNELVQR